MRGTGFQMSYAARRTIAGIVFMAGVLVTLALTALTAWAAYEALSYFSTGAGYEPYGGLHCPTVMSSREMGLVRADFANASDQTQQPYYRVEISGKGSSRLVENQITVPAHTSQQIALTVSADDIDLAPFVFVKLDVLPIGGFSTREATCGIVVVDLTGLNGATAFNIAAACGLLCMLVGLLLPAVGLSPMQAKAFDAEAGSNRRRAMQALAVSAAAGLFAGLMGWWSIALVLLAIGVLLLLMTLSAAISGSSSG